MGADWRVSNSSPQIDREWATSPTVSIVITSKESEEVLLGRIASLRARFDPASTEYVVAWAGPGRLTAELKGRFPHVRLISLSPNTAFGDLRIQGIKAAVGDVVLLIQQQDSSATVAHFEIADCRHPA